MRVFVPLRVCLLVALVVAAALSTQPELTAAAGVNRITSPDTDGDVGSDTSLALDAAGNPVISYHDVTNDDLKVLHCGNPNCTSGNSITSPDTDGGRFTSLALDAAGNPVISYSAGANYNNLRVLHCGNPNCTSGNSINSLDRGIYNSLALDASGNPVVSYLGPRDEGDVELKVLHCNDPDCAGGDESIASLDWGGYYSSLALDEYGNPVVSSALFDDVMVLQHCGNPNCTSGNSRTVPDPGNWVYSTSLALDASGNPVVSYEYGDDPEADLKVLHCNDPDCAGGDESITSPDTEGTIGWSTSLALDAAGNPVVSYFDHTNDDLKVLHCGNPNCTSGNSITSPDRDGFVGWYSSLALDEYGNPVISYHDDTNGDLKVLHCGNPTCVDSSGPVTVIVKVIHGPLRVRDKPGLDGTLRASVPVGDELTVTGPCDAQPLNPDGYCYHGDKAGEVPPDGFGYYWLKVTVGAITGYAAEGDYSGSFFQTTVPADQGSTILTVVSDIYHNHRDHLPVLNSVAPEILLAIAVTESGAPHDLNNEVSSGDSPIGGIMQVHPVESGYNRNCAWDDGIDRNVCSTPEPAGPVRYGNLAGPVEDLLGEPVNEVALGRNYTGTAYDNTVTGIDNNFIDGAKLLNEVNAFSVCANQAGADPTGQRLRCAVWAYNAGHSPCGVRPNLTYLKSVQANTSSSVLSQQEYFGPSYETPFADLPDRQTLSDNLAAFNVVRSWKEGKICSSAELRAYDTQGRVTGLVGGEDKTDIPDSLYYRDSLALFDPAETYTYRVVGEETGTYTLGLASVEEGQVSSFAALELPTSAGAVHQYTIDWSALSLGQEGVTVQVDADGNGIFERTLTSDSELTAEEFAGPVGGIAEMPDVAGSASGSSSPPYAALAGAAAGVVVLAAGGWYARRRWQVRRVT